MLADRSHHAAAFDVDSLSCRSRRLLCSLSHQASRPLLYEAARQDRKRCNAFRYSVSTILHLRHTKKMLFTTEGTMRMLRLAVVAALGLARLGIAQGEILNENNEDSTTTTTSTSTITITTLITSTVTCTSTRGATTCVGPTADLDITSGAVPSTETTSSSTVGTTSSLAAASTNLVSPPDMTTQGKKYVLQGCFAAQDGADGIGQVLGQNYMTPEATDMSLSLCLQECASVVTEGSIATYPYAGVADGR